MIASRSAGDKRDQEPISFSVRPQPTQRLVMPSTAQTLMQGDAIGAGAVASMRFG